MQHFCILNATRKSASINACHFNQHATHRSKPNTRYRPPTADPAKTSGRPAPRNWAAQLSSTFRSEHNVCGPYIFMAWPATA